MSQHTKKRRPGPTTNTENGMPYGSQQKMKDACKTRLKKAGEHLTRARWNYRGPSSARPV